MMSQREGGVEVREAGRALKVQSEVPHLVSLGGGRLSTAVTLHPLPEGRVTIGSGKEVDIVVQGTGVEPIHCHIDNRNGVVTLHPVAEMTSVDGLKVAPYTRLTQGSMVCIGRSNYMRFNHPAEAKLMRSILPNTRISMVPLNFSTGMENADSLDRKPPIAPRRSPRDSWGDVSNSSSCNSGSEECYLGARSEVNARSNQVKTLSPKVFPMGSATVNSPAFAVLGSYHTNNQSQVKNVHTARSPSPSNGFAFKNGDSPKNLIIYSQNIYPTQTPKVNGGILRNGTVDSGSAFSTPVTPKSRSATPTYSVSSNSPSSFTNGYSSRSQTPNSIISQPYINNSPSIMSESLRSVTPSPSVGDNRTIAERRLGSMSSLPSINTSSRESPSPTMKSNHVQEYRVLTTPSPAFNRNPSPASRNVYTPRSVTPSPPKGPRGSNSTGHRRYPSSGSVENLAPFRQVGSPTPSYGSNCSLEELAARKEGLELKRNQAQADRLQEQEVERQERARLDEILNMCADYEKQVQLERQSKSPSIPQNRIKTNGSLPRDKRLPSPGTLMAEDELVDIFTFDQSPPPTTAVPLPPSGPSPKPVGRSPYENVVLSGGSISYPQSPRTRIRTIANKETVHCRDNSEVIENRLAILNDYEFVSSLPRRLSNKSPAMQEPLDIDNKRLTSQQSHNISYTGNTTVTSTVCSPDFHGASQHIRSTSTPVMSNEIQSTSNKKNAERGKLILPLDPVNPVDRLSEAIEAMKAQNANIRYNNRRRSAEFNCETVNQQSIAEPVMVMEKMEQQNMERRQIEYEELRKERSKLLAAMSDLKQNITDIEQQEEEMLRELEMERALLDGEWSAQQDKLAQDQDRQVKLRAQLAKLDQEVAHFSAREVQRQAECKLRLEAAELKVHKLEKELSECTDDVDQQKVLTDRLQAQKDLLDQEKKSFEDLEFRHLEEEADCLAGHEELQRELSDITIRVDTRQRRLAELDEQKLAAQHSAEQESQTSQRQLLALLRRLEEIRNRTRTVEMQIEELTSRGLVRGHDSSPEASSDADEPVRPSSIQSPEDLARISRVTSRAPLELGSGSLGRRTLESLQTIERNRHLHLAQQGGIVIENERKRVEELKRRAQDEVRAQWAVQRQHENNCNSLNSVGSDEVSSDVPTESASSDDRDTVDKHNPAVSNPVEKREQHNLSSIDSNSSTSMMREKELTVERNREETRPLTDGSDYEQQLAVHMRDRDKASRLQHQRPLTRYLPIRSERLDLRQHIETAGHQVELCQHVIIDTTSCRGFLQKLGSTFHHWAKRWFVFDRSQRTFTYFADRSEKKARGGAYFQAIEEVYVDHLNSVKSPSPQLTFVVKTSDRTYHLMAPSAEAMRIWVDVVFTGAEGYQAFEHGL